MINLKAAAKTALVVGVIALVLELISTFPLFFLKTALILYNNGQNCGSIHPPLDRILITNFIKCNNIKEYTYKPWTKLNYNDYWELIALIEKYNSNIDWRLEHYWNFLLIK